jgi:hypothetical protein
MLKQVSCKVKLFYENFLKIVNILPLAPPGTRRRLSPATQKPAAGFPATGFVDFCLFRL